jgi:hypothetical protein
MSITVKGKIERQGFGSGTWALVAATGQTYELYQAPPDLRKVGLMVEVEGTVRDDIATLAMIGPVLEVHQFKVR